MKVYTAFISCPGDPLHCTHKYLGEQSEDQIDAIRKIVASFLDEAVLPSKAHNVEFSIRARFGPRRDLPVLLPEAARKDIFLFELRRRLDRFRKDDFGGFRPHVTTNSAHVVLPFNYLALMSRDEVLTLWPLTR